jgi:hypothetical protein
MATIYKEVEIELELDDFSDEDISREYNLRQTSQHTSYPTELINDIYNAKTLGKNYNALLDQLIYETIGRIVQ